MADRTKSLENLQTALEMELTGVHKYLLHSHILGDRGLNLMAAWVLSEMQEEMGHSSSFTDRILVLGGEPDVKLAKPPKRADTLKELFVSDRKEEGAIEFYSAAVKDALETGDVGTRALCERITLDEEGHLEWLDLQLDLLDRMGEPVFISHHMSAEG